MLGISLINPSNVLIPQSENVNKNDSRLWNLKKPPIVDDLSLQSKKLARNVVKSVTSNTMSHLLVSKENNDSETLTLPGKEAPVRKQYFRDRPWEVRKGGEYAFHGPVPVNCLHPMYYAILEGRTDEVKRLLDDDWNPNGRFIYGYKYDNRLFLANAAHLGKEDVVNVLIQADANLKSALQNNDQLFRYELSNLDETLKRSNIAGLKPNTRLTEFFNNILVKSYNTHDLEAIKNNVISKYSDSVKLLLDHAFGLHFSNEELKFLAGLDVSGFNFVGVSVDGHPVTREMLVKKGLEIGFKGAKDAIVTKNDISKVEDESRRDKLLIRLEKKCREQGKVISKEGIINLVPIYESASRGDDALVKLRLEAGVDPNEITEMNWDAMGYPIVAAVKHGHLEIVKLLARHPEIDLKVRYQALLIAEDSNLSEIVKFLKPLHTVNDLNMNGNTLLHHAVMKMDFDEVGNLLALGADPNQVDNIGRPPHQILTEKIMSQIYFKNLEKKIFSSQSMEEGDIIIYSLLYTFTPSVHIYDVVNDKVIKMLKLLKAHGATIEPEVEHLLTD